jgi:hypothetical protein
MSPEEPGSPGWKVFMQGLGVVKDVSVVFPPLQAAVTGLFRVLEKFEASPLGSFPGAFSWMQFS